MRNFYKLSRTVILIFGAFLSSNAYAQTAYVMGSSPATNNSTIQACSGILYDDGGINGNYSSNQDIKVTLEASSGHEMLLDFGVFALHSSEYLYVYDGSSTSASQVSGSPFTGSYIPANIISTSGSLTIRLVASGSSSDKGFELAFLCVPKSTLGYTYLTWDGASTGSQTSIQPSSSAASAFSPATDQLTGCPSSGSSSSFDVDFSFDETVGSVFDAMRSGTYGAYGSPYFTMYMDNYDNGASPNSAYNPGDEIQMRFDFEHPLQIVSLVIGDVDADDASNPPSGSSSFQDKVVVKALGLSNDTVDVDIAIMKSGRLNQNGQEILSTWTNGANTNIAPDSLRASIHISTESPIKSLIIRYIAGPDDPNPAQQAIRLSAITCGCPSLVELAGNIFNDANGLSNSTVDGPGIGNPSSATLYVNLVDSTTGLVVATTTVGSGGAYSFSDVTGNYNYVLQLSTTAGTPGSAMPTSSLPSAWAATGENIGSGTGNDGNVDQLISLALGTSNISNINYGIDRIPVANNSTTTLTLSPATDDIVPIGSFVYSNPSLTGSDAEDGYKGNGDKMAITSLPTNGELYYNGSQVIYGDDGTNPPSASNPFTLASYDSTALQIKMTGSGYTTTEFDFVVYDAAGIVSAPATYELEWPNPVPVTWLSFDVHANGPQSAKLLWSTATEINNKGFEVERSYNGSEFEKIGFVEGIGNSSAISDYQYIDLSIAANQSKVFYRLKQIDFNGEFEYSEVKSLDLDIINPTITPNPTTGVVYLSGLSEFNGGQYTLTILDAQGKEIERSSILIKNSSEQTRLDLSNFKKGVYIIRVEGETSSTEFKVVKY